jgi:uncharacterized protein (TIGR02145 family)
LGSSSISSGELALSTGTWNITSGSSYSLAEAEANPTTFYTRRPGDSSIGWRSMKNVHDPCPVGWRVPDGGDDGVWAKALGTSNEVSLSGDSINHGINFSGLLGDAEFIWYPASGCRRWDSGDFTNSMYWSSGGFGVYYWSCHPTHSMSLEFDFSYGYPSRQNESSYGFPVRCLKETDKVAEP